MKWKGALWATTKVSVFCLVMGFVIVSFLLSIATTVKQDVKCPEMNFNTVEEYNQYLVFNPCVRTLTFTYNSVLVGLFSIMSLFMLSNSLWLHLMGKPFLQYFTVQKK